MQLISDPVSYQFSDNRIAKPLNVFLNNCTDISYPSACHCHFYGKKQGLLCSLQQV